MRSLLLSLVIVVALAISGCSKSYSVGNRVLVQWEGHEYPAVILAVEAPGRYRVHFEGYESIWDESVPATRIVRKVTEPLPPAPPPPPKVRARMAAGNKVSLSTFKIGDRVKVEWKATYYPATILMVLGGERYRVHYDGYDQNWDEDVEIARIQRK